MATAPAARSNSSAGRLVERVRDGHRPRRLARSAEDDVAARVHREGALAGQRRRRAVGGESLGGPAEVEPHAGRPPDLPPRGEDRPPQRTVRRSRRAPRRRHAQRIRQRGRRCVPARLRVAGGLERSDQGWVDEAAAPFGRVDRCGDRAGREPGADPRRLGVRVQVTQLAVRIEAAQLQMAGAQHRLGGRDRQLGRRRPSAGSPPARMPTVVPNSSKLRWCSRATSCCSRITRPSSRRRRPSRPDWSWKEDPPD